MKFHYKIITFTTSGIIDIAILLTKYTDTIDCNDVPTKRVPRIKRLCTTK